MIHFVDKVFRLMAAILILCMKVNRKDKAATVYKTHFENWL